MEKQDPFQFKTYDGEQKRKPSGSIWKIFLEHARYFYFLLNQNLKQWKVT